MTSPTAARVAARLARREVQRRPWRTLLVALLVALPVAGMTVAVGFVRTDRYDADVTWSQTWGASSDVGLQALERGASGNPNDVPDLEAAMTSLPAGSRTTTWRSAHTILRTVERQRAAVQVLDLPLASPIGNDVVQLTSGRAPTEPGEVFLSRALAKELGVWVGDPVDLERPYRATWRVAGVGELRSYWDSYTAALTPTTPFPWDRSRDMGAAVNHAVDLPHGVSRQQLRSLAAVVGAEALAPHLRSEQVREESNTSEVAWSWVIGAIVLTVVGIVIASAFAAGARRQLTTLGQMAANGAAPSVLRQVLFLQGTWTGMIGSLLGLVLGGSGLGALAPHADRVLGRDVHPWDVRALDLVPVVLLGVLAATVAALVPARTTVRVPVLAALAGRRPLAKVPRWVTGAGAVASVCGLGLLGLAVLGGRDATHDTQLWALTAILGGMAILLGACAMTPGYTSALLEPLAARVGGAWRLAARSLARQRTRSSAVVAGVCAASALAVGAAGFVLSLEADETRSRPEQMRADDIHVSAELVRTTGDERDPQVTSEPVPAPPDLVDSLRVELPGSQVLDVAMVKAPAGHQWFVEQPSTGNPEDDYVAAFGAGFLAAAVWNPSAERAYELRSEHRDLLEKHGALLLGRADQEGALTFVPVGSAEQAPPGAGAVAVGRSSNPGPLPSRAPHPVPVVDAQGYALGMLPRLLVTPASAGRIGFVPSATMTVVRTSEAMDRRRMTLVNDLIEDYRLDTSSSVATSDQLNVFTQTRSPDTGLNPLLLELVLTGTALLFSLFVVVVSLALAAAETRDERDVLTVVGAPPRTLWETSGRKAVLLTALGGALAVPVGFLPVVVLVLASDPTPPLVFPWRIVALLLVAVPLLAGLVTTTGSALALRVRPMRISTMAFD
jgi:putative ABC transport system permease protein